jgi:hypothetical protein
MEYDSIEEACRLCFGRLTFEFQLRILAKYDASYFKCMSCGSLQTELPYWLEESYQDGNLADLDTGSFQRNLQNLPATVFTAIITQSKVAIDFGGGDGLLSRMVRDYGVNIFVSDKYGKNTYAKGFSKEIDSSTDLVTSFEVFEHFANPASDLDDIFGFNPKAVLVTTGRFKNQDSNWIYLSPESGQHVFFYSQNALKFIAKKYGYRLVLTGKYLPLSGYSLFLKSRNPFVILSVHVVLNPIFCWISKGIFSLFPGIGAVRDQKLLKSKT